MPEPEWYFLGRAHPEQMTPATAAAFARFVAQVAALQYRQTQHWVAAWDALVAGQYDQLEIDPVPTPSEAGGGIPNLTRWGQSLRLEVVPVQITGEAECGVCGRLLRDGAPALAFAYTSPRRAVWVYRYECPFHFGSWLAEKEGVRLKRRERTRRDPALPGQQPGLSSPNPERSDHGTEQQQATAAHEEPDPGPAETGRGV